MPTSSKKSSAKGLTHHHKDGSIWAKGKMTGDKMQGYWEWFRKDGTVMRTGYFDKGIQTGQWTTYDKNGKIVKVTKMKEPMAEKKGKLAVIKTKETSASVESFINAVPDEQKRKDSFVILEMMKKASGEKAKIWGSAIIGFGNKRYKSPNTDREVDWFIIGFSPRKANLTIYLIDMSKHAAALKKLGKHKIGGGCLYINKLGDIDLKVLKGMIEAAIKRK